MKHIILISLILLGVLCILVGSQEAERRRKRPQQGRPSPRRPYQGRPYRRRPVPQDDYYDDDDYEDDYDDEPLPPRRNQKLRDKEADERQKEFERFQQYERDRKNSLCPEPTGFFPDAVQCDKYHECTNWKMVTKLCADGLAFVEGAPKIEKCDFIHTVDCKERSMLQTPQPTLNCQRQNGYFAHADCDKFYQCAGGISIVQTCPTGLIFADATRTCNYPDPSKPSACKPNTSIPYYKTEEWINAGNATQEKAPSPKPKRKFTRRNSTTTTTTSAPLEYDDDEPVESTK